MRLRTKLALGRIAAIYRTNTGINAAQQSALGTAALKTYESGGDSGLASAPSLLGELADALGGSTDSEFYKAMSAYLGPLYEYIWNQAYANILDITCAQGKARFIHEMVAVSVEDWDSNTALVEMADTAKSAGETVVGANDTTALEMKSIMEQVVQASVAVMAFGEQGSTVGLRLMTPALIRLMLTQAGTQHLLESAGAAQYINATNEELSKANPGLSIVQVMDPGIQYGAQATGLSSVFLNHIPAIEMSRAGVYFSLGINLSGPQIDPNSGAFVTMGQVRFLSPEGALVSTVPTNADRYLAEAAGPGGDPEKAREVAGYAGMELFTSPQTLVNFDGVAENAQLGAIGAQDKTRPFMTLTSFTVNVVPSRGAMSTQTAELSLTLHDRSRLKEISELVQPHFLGRLELLCEWGWAHPDPYTSDFGALIDSLRTAQKFSVYKSSFQFTDSGQVEISLSLISKGASQVNFTDAAMSGNVREKWEAVEEAMEGVKVIRKTVLGMHGIKDATGTSEISTLSLTSTGNLISGESARAIQTWITKYRAGSGTASELAAKLKALKDAVASATATLETELEKKWSNIMKGVTHDPWMLMLNGGGDKVRVLNESAEAPWRKQIARRDYKGEVCSFGKLAMLFMGLPLANSGLYDEVQLIFYTANDMAGWFAGGNLGSLPVDLRPVGGKTMEDLLKAEYKKYGGRYPVVRIMQWIAENYIESQYSLCYGLSANTTPGTGGASNFTLKEGKITPLDPGSGIAGIQANNEKTLRKAYYGDANQKVDGGGPAPTPFRPINLKIHMEVLQGDEESAALLKAGSMEEVSGVAQRTILRCHFIDAGASNSSGMDRILRKFKDSDSGLVSRSAPTRMWAGMNQDLFSELISRSAKAEDSAWEEMEKLGVVSSKATYTVGADYSAEEIIQAQNLILEIEAAVADGNMEDSEEVQNELDYNYELVDSLGDLPVFSGFMLTGDAQALLNWMQTQLPYIKYGSEGTNIKSLNVQTTGDSKTASMYMVRQANSRGAAGPTQKGLPMQTMPVQLSVTMMGNPLVEYMQQYFINLGTGTSLDNRYACIGLSHKITPGSYETEAEFVPLDAYATFRSATAKLDEGMLTATAGESVTISRDGAS